MNVVYEGDVVSRVPVKAVVCAGEWNCVQQSVDRSNNLQFTFIYHLHQSSSGATHICSVLLSRAVDDRQAARDEVVLEGWFSLHFIFQN